MPGAFIKMQQTKSKEIRTALATAFANVYDRQPSTNMERLGPKYEAVVTQACTTLGIFPLESRFNEQLTIADAVGKIFLCWYLANR